MYGTDVEPQQAKGPLPLERMPHVHRVGVKPLLRIAVEDTARRKHDGDDWRWHVLVGILFVADCYSQGCANPAHGPLAVAEWLQVRGARVRVYGPLAHLVCAAIFACVRS